MHLPSVLHYLESPAESLCLQVIDTITELLTDNANLLLPDKTELTAQLGKRVNELFVQNISKSLNHQHHTQLLGANFVTCLRIICSLNGQPLPFAQCLVMDHCFVGLMAQSNDPQTSNPISQIRISKKGKVEISCPAEEKGSLNWHADRWIDVASFHDLDWSRDLESCTVEEKIYRCCHSPPATCAQF